MPVYEQFHSKVADIPKTVIKPKKKRAKTTVQSLSASLVLQATQRAFSGTESISEDEIDSNDESATLMDSVQSQPRYHSTGNNGAVPPRGV